MSFQSKHEFSIICAGHGYGRNELNPNMSKEDLARFAFGAHLAHSFKHGRRDLFL
jgi:hypothetical protein